MHPSPLAPIAATARTLCTWRTAAKAAIGLSLVTIASTGVMAGLNATTSNAAPMSVDAGTLRLTMSNTSPSAGFSTSITNLAPGDVVNRYVDLTNGGTLAGQSLALSIASTGTASLITDGVSPSTTRALRVTVSSCSVAWNQSTGACPGTVTTELSSAALSAYATNRSLATTSLASNESLRLQVQVALPDQNETTVDGVLPTNTVQGGSVALTYTFVESQRTATTTNS